MPDDDDKRVKDQLIDPATRASLERWFGLPSFEQLADEGKQPEQTYDDDGFAEAARIRKVALANVDPRLLDELKQRVDALRRVLPFQAAVDVQIPEIMSLDESMIAKLGAIADPREIDRGELISNAVTERTPQALLRDLHRPENYFQKQLEWVDFLGQARTDVAAAISEAMKPRRALPARESLFMAARREILEIYALRRIPWTKVKMPNRTVTE